MKRCYCVCFAVFVCFFEPLSSLSLENVNLIGEKIWKNECGATIEGLVHWNQGEEFPSLGIGHFIWYPVGKKGRFEETFPELVQFLQKERAQIPSWLVEAQGAPWCSREEFYLNKESSQVQELYKLLFDTKSLQALFIVHRLERAIVEMTSQKEVAEKFCRLVEDPKGLYALIDYINFKGTGLAASESYQGQGWGLLQVLQDVPATSKDIVADFVASAKKILSQRVKNSPSERNEKRWLGGWFNRLDTYTKG